MIALDNGDKIRGDAPVINEVDYLIFGFVGTVATQLADGQLPAAIGDLYTAPADGIGISSIVLVNTGAVARAVNLYLTPNAGVARRLTPEDYSLAAGYVLITDGKSIHNFPSGAATLAEQQTQTTALQLIDNLVAALESVATDRLIVRGEDQLFSLKNVVALTRDVAVSGADGTGDSLAVPAGEYWVITTAACTDITTATTRMLLSNNHNGADIIFRDETAAFATGARLTWSGITVLDVGDFIRGHFVGSLVGDTVRIEITGYAMTLEV